MTISCFQVFIRFYTLIAKRASLVDLIESCKYFWKFDVFEDSIKQQLTTILDRLLKYQKVFVYSCYFTVVLVCGYPLLQKTYTLPFASWVPDGYPYLYGSIYVLQCILFVTYLHVVIGFDCAFARICVEVILQFS